MSNRTECIRTTVRHAGPYKTPADVEFAAAGWVDWYNNCRLHGTLGMITPVEHETAYYEALNREPQRVKRRQRAWDASLSRGSITDGRSVRMGRRLFEDEERSCLEHARHALKLLKNQPAQIGIVPGAYKQDDLKVTSDEANVLNPRK